MRKYLFLLVAFAFSVSVYAERLYWVGGFGNFNDPSHWSRTSGGNGGAKIPGASDDVVFDKFSFKSYSIVKVLGEVKVHDFIVESNINRFELEGSQFSSIVVGGSFLSSSSLKNSFLGKLIFTSNQEEEISFSNSIVNGDVIFDGEGVFNLRTFKTGPTSTLNFKRGEFNFNGTGIHTQNFIANSGRVKFNFTYAILNVAELFILGNNVEVVDSILYLEARLGEPAFYQVSNNVHFSSSAKIISNNSTLACAFALLSVTNPTCAGSCNGVVRLNIPAACAGTSGPNYQVTWVAGNAACSATAPAFNGSVPPGVLTVNGVCGCSAAYTVIFAGSNGGFAGSTIVSVTDPPAVSAFFIPTQPSCNGSCNGRIDAIIVGGNQPYSVNWAPSGQVHAGNLGNDSLVNQCILVGLSQTYTVDITDANNCPFSFNATLTQPSVITPSGASNIATCNGVCDASAFVNPSGGTGAYTYVWDSNLALTNDTLNNLCAPSTHSVVVTDGNGCTATYSANLSQPTDFTYTKSVPALLACNDVCNGTANVTAVSGATPPYSFSWLGAPAPTVSSTATTSTATAMCAGNYSVVVTDALGCDDTATFTINAPALLVGSVVTTDPLCFNGNNGTATASSVGGTGAVTFHWFTSAGASLGFANPINTLTAGTYSLVATDFNGCDDTTIFVVNNPAQLVVTSTPTNPTCFGLTNGQVCGSSVGGTGAVSFTFSPAGGVVAGNCYTGLSAVNYIVTGTDANGCTDTDNSLLVAPTQILVGLTHTDPTCDNACNGTATTNASGGSGAGYTYSWSCDVSTASSIGGQCAGACVVTVTDGAGCTQSANVTFIDPNPLTVVLTNTNLNCSGATTAQITSAVNGGTPGYTYSWSPGGQVTPGLANVGAGGYDLTVTDAKGCTATDHADVTAPAAITITTTLTDPTCSGASTGSISTVLGGGTAPYTVMWLPTNSTNLNQINLPAGSYTINVTDALGCLQSDTVVLNQPVAVTVTTDTTVTSCVGSSNGTATASAVGGNGVYTYLWNDALSQTTQTATGLVVGNYIVTVTDGLGCTGSATATITEPPVLTVLVNSITPSCSNICNGTATIVPSGGTAPYSYTLDGNPIGAVVALSGLCTGAHIVVITDANGCTTSTNFNVPPLVTITITTSTTTLTCFGDCNGTATATVTGATGALTYNWTPTGQPTQTAVGLCSGIHTVTATDQNGCQVTSTATFIDPPVLTAPLTVVQVDCGGNCIGSASVVPAGGVAPYSVTWSNGGIGNSISNLCVGVFTGTITDNNGCSISQVANIVQPSSFTVVGVTSSPTICGASDGSITVTPSGVGPYTYSWTAPGGNAATLSNIPSGIYSVTIIDTNTGCDTIIPYGLSDPGGPTTDGDSTDVTCPGLCNGTVTVNVLASTGPATVTFPNGGPSGAAPLTANGLCAAVYVVQVTDATACNSFQTVTVNQPSNFADNDVVTNVSCNGGNNGSIVLSPTGGTRPFTYTINGVADDSSMTNLTAGVYAVVITDANNCTYPINYTVTEPTALTASEVHTNVNCITGFGTSTITPAGGTNPYTYSWSAPSVAVTQTVNNLVQGNYICTVTDTKGCTTSVPVAIGQNSALVSGFTFTNNLCNAGSTGTATFNASGGSGVYTYSWSHTGSVASSQVGIGPGNYSATVTDNNGCSVVENYSIVAPALLTASSVATDPSCNGNSNGSITATPAGGTPGYTYVWNPNISNSASALNLSAGSYTVDINDLNGCTVQLIDVLTNPSALFANINSTEPTCFGLCNGILASVPVGGTLPYTFSWGPAPTVGVNDSLINLCSATYSVVVTDNNGCKDTASVTLTDPPQVGLAASTSPATCGLVPCNGSITINNIVGNNVVWLNSVPPGFNGLVQNNLCAGVYNIEVSDINGCKDTVQVPVSNASGPIVNVDSTDVTCVNTCNGTATVVSVVGTGPFTYSWAAPIPDLDSIASNLCAGTYISQVTDAINCITLTSITINQPSNIDDHEVITTASCAGVNNGSIILAPIGGTGALHYAWSNNPGLDSPNNIGLAPGAYSVVITDANLCTYPFAYVVGSSAQLQYQLTTTNVTCFSQCNGTAVLNNLAGGTAPYTFTWNDGQTGTIANALCAGNYSVTITDALGCSRLVDTTIIEPTQVIANPTITNTACGVCAGSVAMAPSGGTGVFTYLWSDGQSNSTASNLCAGVYMVNVTDAAGCLSQFNVAVNNTNGPTLTVSSTDVNCAGLCTGTASVVAAGGTTPYQYNWISGGQTTAGVANLCAGTYFVQVKDASNCLVNDSVVINELNTIAANPSLTATTCGASVGQASVAPSGGTPPYTFVWSTGSVNDTISNLAAGTYSVEITDATACKDTFFITINSNNGPVVSVATDSALCNGSSDGGATLTINGANAPYTVLWSNGSVANPTVAGLDAGNYSVSITDASGCVTVENFTIDEPSPIALSLNNTILPTCQAACNGSISAIPSGGTLPYSYLWSPGNQNTSTISNQCAGLYSLLVTDAKGCSISQNTQLINNPNPFNVTAVNVDATCGQCDGTSALTLNGGQAPYSYLWSNGDITPNSSGLCAGVYMVDLADNLGCTQQYNVAINNTNGPTVTPSSTDVSCASLSDGTASTVVSGGIAPYQYNWINGGQTTSAVNNLSAGIYFVQVKDAANCLTNAQVTINQTTTLVANPVITSATCGALDGAVTLNTTGGAGGYTYVWQAPLVGVGPTQINLAAGNYSVVTTDAAGCKDTTFVSISSTNAPGVIVDVDSVSCFGLSDGSVTLTINGGTPGYTVLWSTGSAANPTLNGLSAGNYAVTVTDAANCVSAQNFSIEEPVKLALSLSNSQLPNCSGVCNGELTAIPNGGSLAYTYLWMPGNGTADTIAGLCAGSYTLTVTDANGCVATQTSNLINNPTPFNIDTTIVSPGCNLCNGSIDLIMIGGAIPYTYNWSSGDTLEDITNVCAGVYQVDITDSVGCSQTATFAISNINGITGETIVKTDESCFGSADGTAVVTPVGGTPGYTYLWPHNGATVNNLVGMPSGTYFLEITDTNNCVRTSQVDILSPNQMLATPVVVSPNCAVSDGSITLNVSGGTGALTYSWNPAVAGNTNIATNLAAGVYTITVTDASTTPCSQSFTVALGNVNGPQVAVFDTSISCNGVCDGSINLVVTNVNPTGILWSDGTTGTAITNLCEGIYTAIVTDQVLFCSTVISATIVEPDTISFGMPITTDLKCFGVCLGTIATTPFGGTLPYNYAWAPSGDTGPAVDSLCAGINTLTITDNNGCVASQNTTLTQPTDIVTTGVVSPAACSSVPNGAIDVTVNGGTPFVGGIYTYQWLTGSVATTQDLNGVLFGNYSLEVTDSLLCKDTVSYVITTTDTVTANAGPDAAFCLTGSVILDGSGSFINNGTITYQWNEIAAGTLLGNTDSVTIPAVAGTTNYQLIITNSIGCSDTDTVALTANPLPVASAGPDLEIVYGLTGTIGGSPTGPVGTTVVWTPNTDLTNDTIPNPVSSTLSSLTYVVTVTDTATGCVAKDSMEYVILPDVVIPNGISPNGDGKNDTWIITLINKFPDNDVEVYNRWGELLYSKHNYDNSWDGTYKGKGLPVGTYYYVVKLNDPKYPDAFTGPITIFK